MSDKPELETFDALKMLTEFFVENEIDSETMAYMIERFYSAIGEYEEETPRMALAEAKHVFDTDYDQAN